jgi:hypothetical protein
MKIYSHIENGQLSDHAQVALAAELAHHDGKDIELAISRKRKKRSLNQNQYYWAVVVPLIRAMMEEYGNELDDEETHSFLKEHVGKLTSSVVDSVGRRLAVVKSSASLSTAEFEAYLLKVTAWAAQEGVIIPSPNEHLEPPIEAYHG